MSKTIFYWGFIITFWGCVSPSSHREPASIIYESGTLQATHRYSLWRDDFIPINGSMNASSDCEFEKTRLSPLSSDLQSDSPLTQMLIQSAHAQRAFNGSLRKRLDSLFSNQGSKFFSAHFPRDFLCPRNPQPAWVGTCHGTSLGMADKLLQSKINSTGSIICNTRQGPVGLERGYLVEASYLMKSLEAEDQRVVLAQLGYGSTRIKSQLSALKTYQSGRLIQYEELAPEFYQLYQEWNSLHPEFFTFNDQTKAHLPITVLKNQFPDFANNTNFDERNLNANNLLIFLEDFYHKNSQLGLIIETSMEEAVFNYYVHRLEIISPKKTSKISFEDFLPNLKTFFDLHCPGSRTFPSFCSTLVEMLNLKDSMLNKIHQRAFSYDLVSMDRSKRNYQQDLANLQSYVRSQQAIYKGLLRNREFSEVVKNYFARDYYVKFFYQPYSPFGQSAPIRQSERSSDPQWRNQIVIHLRLMESAVFQNPLPGRIVQTTRMLYNPKTNRLVDRKENGLGIDLLWIPSPEVSLLGEKLLSPFWKIIESDCASISRIDTIVREWNSLSRGSPIREDLLKRTRRINTFLIQFFSRGSGQEIHHLKEYWDNILRIKVPQKSGRLISLRDLGFSLNP